MQVHYVRLLHMKSERVLHTIDPVFNAETRVLLLGSFPSPKSREVGFFYGHPQNRMWRVLATVMGEDAVPLTAEERTAFCFAITLPCGMLLKVVLLRAHLMPVSRM